MVKFWKFALLNISFVTFSIGEDEEDGEDPSQDSGRLKLSERLEYKQDRSLCAARWVGQPGGQDWILAWWVGQNTNKMAREWDKPGV